MAGGNSQIWLRTTFTPSVVGLEGGKPLEISVVANSSNAEVFNMTEDNQIHINLPVIVETNIILRGLADPQPLQHNVSNYPVMTESPTTTDLLLTESDIGPEVTHIYQIENKGPSDILEAQVYILWPSFRPNGDPLLYLTYQPLVEGKGRCDYVSDVNLYQIKMDKGRGGYRRPFHSSERTKRYLTSSQEVTQSLETSSNISSSYTVTKTSSTSVTSSFSAGGVDSSTNTQLNSSQSEQHQQMDCGPTQCTYITCRVGPLKKKEDVVFRVRSRLWSSTLAKLTHQQYEISSRMVAQVTQLPHNVDPTYLGLRTYTVTTRNQPARLWRG